MLNKKEWDKLKKVTSMIISSVLLIGIFSGCSSPKPKSTSSVSSSLAASSSETGMIVSTVVSSATASTSATKPTNTASRAGTTTSKTSSSSSSRTGGTTSTPAVTVPSSGTIKLEGSLEFQALVNAAIPSFKAKYQKAPGVITITCGGTDSLTGISAVSGSAVNIGNSDVNASIYESDALSGKLVDHTVCTVGYGVIIDKSLGIKDLTTAQLKAIYTGVDANGKAVINWSDVVSGAPSTPITVVVRAQNSDTRIAFDTAAFGSPLTAIRSDSALKSLTTPADVEAEVNTANSGAIGYLAFPDLLKDSTFANITNLTYNGVAPSYKNITAGSYPLWGYEHMYTYGTPDALTQAFITYITSPAFTATLTKMNYGTVK